MISAALKTQNNGTDNRLNESDKLLSDKYILAKDIRDLNRTLQDSTDRMNILEVEVKNKLKLKEQFEQYIHASFTDKKGGLQHKTNEFIEKLNTEPDLHELNERIKNEKSESINVKQQMIDNNHQFTDEISILREKIKNRNNANSEVQAERDNMKAKMRNIIEEIACRKSIEDEER
jgi:predicted  nucleic acid-binding Zn-ribbon protein